MKSLSIRHILKSAILELLSLQGHFVLGFINYVVGKNISITVVKNGISNVRQKQSIDAEVSIL